MLSDTSAVDLADGAVVVILLGGEPVGPRTIRWVTDPRRFRQQVTETQRP